ncbi:hypothetical protein GCM10009006_34720 [Haloarcula argentinensis]|uniref:Uncharacterized protein n=1 Tax=Haloarcula argentinensis TaxID=43776 RepID=A0A830FRE8_HALAR|nr:hypothetical protein GCM10009006_34720 [Haloarcula argentinensis]
MIALMIIGLLMSFIGGVLAVIPDIPKRYNLLQRIWPLKSVRLAEDKLYREGEITQADDRTEYLSNALMESSQPYDRTSDYGTFSEFGACFEIPEGEIRISYDDCTVDRIIRTDENPLSQSCFTVQLVPDDPDFVRTMKPHVENGQLPVIQTEIPAGRLPAIVTEYKRNIVRKIGIALLSTGFLFQLVDLLYF